MNKTISLLTFLIIALSGCSINIQDIQDIEISVYDDIKSNTELVEGLIYYDLRVLVDRIPSLNEENIKGIRLGYFIRSSDQKPFYRITYDMTNTSVAKSISGLKSDFEKHIPELARLNAIPEAKKNELESISNEWWKLFEEEDFQSCWARLEIEDPSVTYEVFERISHQTLEQLGRVESKNLLYLHYYEEAIGETSVYSLMYETNFEKRSGAYMRTAITYDEKSDWSIVGFGRFAEKQN